MRWFRRGREEGQEVIDIGRRTAGDQRQCGHSANEDDAKEIG